MKRKIFLFQSVARNVGRETALRKMKRLFREGKKEENAGKNALRQVPVTTLILLIALTFVYISFVRKPESSTPKQTRITQVTENPNSSIQKAVLFQSDEKLKEHYEKTWQSDGIRVGRGVSGG